MLSCLWRRAWSPKPGGVIHTRVMATADAVNTIAESLERDQTRFREAQKSPEIVGSAGRGGVPRAARRDAARSGRRRCRRPGRPRKRTDGGVFFSSRRQLPQGGPQSHLRGSVRPGVHPPESERREAEAAAKRPRRGARFTASARPSRVPVPARAEQRRGTPPRVVEVEVLRTFRRRKKEERPQDGPRPGRTRSLHRASRNRSGKSFGLCVASSPSRLRAERRRRLPRPRAIAFASS